MMCSVSSTRDSSTYYKMNIIEVESKWARVLYIPCFCFTFLWTENICSAVQRAHIMLHVCLWCICEFSRCFTTIPCLLSPHLVCVFNSATLLPSYKPSPCSLRIFPLCHPAAHLTFVCLPVCLACLNCTVPTERHSHGGAHADEPAPRGYRTNCRFRNDPVPVSVLVLVPVLLLPFWDK